MAVLGRRKSYGKGQNEEMNVKNNQLKQLIMLGANRAREGEFL